MNLLVFKGGSIYAYVSNRTGLPSLVVEGAGGSIYSASYRLQLHLEAFKASGQSQMIE